MNPFLKQYEDKAEQYMNAQNAFYAKHSDKSRENFYRYIPTSVQGKRLLDAGCGFGKDVAHFKKEGAEVYGFDESEKMIELATKSHPDISTFSVQEFEDLTYTDGFFDIIISRYALYYATDLEKAFYELNRVLKPGGTMTLLVAHPLLTFIAKKDRNYHQKKIVEIPLFENTFTVTEPSRTLNEYLNPFILQHLDLQGLFEGPGLENAPQENSFREIVPDYLVLVFRKREEF